MDRGLSKVMEFAARFFERSVWRDHVELNEEGVMAALTMLSSNPSAYFEMTDAGAIGGMLTPLWFSPDVLIASELFWYSEQLGEGAKLRERFEAWAKSKGARFIQFSAMANEHEERLRRTLATQGYHAKEIGFIKEI